MNMYKIKKGEYKKFMIFTFLSLFFLMLIPFKSFGDNRLIENAIREHIKDNYPWADIEVNDLILERDVYNEIPEKIIVERGLPGRTIFLIEFKNGKKIKANANIKAFDWVVMSRRSQRKGYIIQKEDVYITLMELSRIPKGALRNASDVIGMPLSRSIVSNTPLLDNMVDRLPMVKKGQRVVLLVESPDFNITTLGEIKENSYIGNYVKVVNLSSKKILIGRLVDENTVKVDF